MGLFNSGNPSFREDTYDKVGHAVDAKNVMTVNGAIGKTGILFILVFLSAMLSWNMASSLTFRSYVMPLMWLSLVAGFVLSLIIIFKQTTASYLSPVYAFFEGFFLGGLSVLVNSYYPGIAFQALSLTFLVVTIMLILYRFRIIRATQRFKTVVIAATMAIGIFYLIGFVLSLFSITVPLIYSSSLLGIGFSIFVVVLAALNLIIDFDFIETGAQIQAPKYMEWYGAFGLMVTLVWMYVEILRLLMKIADSQR